MDYKKLPKGFVDTLAPAASWEVGYLFTWSEPFNNWIQHNTRLTIKPGETGLQAAKREGITIDGNTLVRKLLW